MKSIPISELKSLGTPISDAIISHIDSYEVFYEDASNNVITKVTFVAKLPKNKSIILDTVGDPIKVDTKSLNVILKDKLDEHLKSNICSTCVCNIDGLCPYGRDGKSIDKPCMHIDNIEGMVNLTNWIERPVEEELPEGYYKQIEGDVLTNLMLSIWLVDNNGFIYNSSTGKLSNTFIYPISESNKPVDESIKVVSHDNAFLYATGTSELPKDKKDIIDALVIDRSIIISDLNDTIEMHNALKDAANNMEILSGE